MIVKEKTATAPQDKFGAAGHQAEMQMAFYLRRAFAESPDLFVFNDLRLIRNGEVAQIDHLVLHRFGFVIIESKSVTGTIEVNEHQEFVRTFGSNRTGMKSPIIQAQMQAGLLQRLLNDYRESLRRKVILGAVQGYFGPQRFKTLVAVSDQGVIQRHESVPPQLVKAEHVVARILDYIQAHTNATGVGNMVKYILSSKDEEERYRRDLVPPLTPDEHHGIITFLLSQHSPSQHETQPSATRTN